MNALQNCLIVGAAGFIGAIVRYLVVAGCRHSELGKNFKPLGTLVVNVTGCFAIGWVIMFLGSRAGASQTLRLAIVTGFLGAYTTFSAFALETDALIQRGSWGIAALNIIASVVAGLLAVRLGIVMGAR